MEALAISSALVKRTMLVTKKKTTPVEIKARRAIFCERFVEVFGTVASGIKIRSEFSTSRKSSSSSSAADSSDVDSSVDPAAFAVFIALVDFVTFCDLAVFEVVDSVFVAVSSVLLEVDSEVVSSDFFGMILSVISPDQASPAGSESSMMTSEFMGSSDSSSVS